MSTEPLVEGRCPSPFTLERLHQGELGGESWRTATAHARQCPACTRQLEELTAPPPALDLARVWREGRPPGWAERVRGWRPMAAFALVASAAAAIAVFRPGPETQVKGSAPWSVAVIARHRDGSVSRVAPGAALRPGERLRFEVTTSWKSGHVVLVSLDTRGTVSPLAPVRGNATLVKGGVKTLLDGAVELDDSLGGERVLLVGCPYAASVDMVVGAASAALSKAGGDPRRVTALALGCHEESLWFEKVPR